ncbi:titin-like isoform X2 [Macrobrachium nipponense]|uniref:titin-like isoform X2 n=1 Tax=Macrobrachium nipponense TaxID=159736 RepID=UPI0030C896FE
MGNKQGHELSPEEKQRLKEEKRLLKEDKEHKKRLRKIEQRRLKDEKRKGTGGSSSAAATPATVKKDTEDAQSVGGSSVWSEKSVGSAPESWYHSASEPGSKRSSIYLPASAGPGYYQHDCWYSGYEDSGSEKSKPSSRAGSRPGSRPPSRAPSVKDTLNLRSSSLERYPLGVPTGEAIEPMHKAGSLDLANVVATNFLENREQLAGELEIAAAIASRYDETIRASKEQLEKTSVDKASLIDRASLTDKISLTSSIYHSAEEGSTRGEKRKVHLEDRESLSSVYYSADEASIGSKRKVFDYGSDHTSATGSIYYSADEGGSVAGSVYYTATSGSEVEDHVTDAEILGKDRPSPPSKPVAVDREGSALSRLAYIKVENDALLLHWEAPESDGGTPISGYILERCEGDGDFWVRVNLVPIKDTEYAVANLIGGREYRFRVSAENAVGVSDPSERSEMVSISTDQEATEPHFLKELRDVTAVEGHRVEFIVDIIGTPPPDVSWYKDGFEIFDTKRFEFVADGDRYSLVLKEAKISDAGDIRVRATNRVGVASSQAVLHIQAPPRITLPPQYEQGLIFDTDELIRLRVPYTGRPPPLATWAHNGKEIEVDDRHTMDVSEKYITLKIAGANRADKGMYSLNLANPQGIDNVSFFVTVTDRPDPPSMPVVTDITGQSVTLRWDPPQDDGGCRISNYIVEYFRMGWDVWLKGASSRITWTQLSELIVGSEYRFRVKAENAYGVSDPGEECEPVLIDETKSPSGSFDFETYKSTTAVGSSLPRDSATLIKEEGSSFEYGSSDIGSEGATDSVEKAKLQGMGASDEVESSLDLGSSSEKGHSLDYGGSMERGASYELGASMERGASYELGASMERGASYELGASMERGDSYELGASMERGASYELGASMERGASYELGASMERGDSYELGASMERGASYDLGSSLERGASYELGSSIERGASYDLESSLERGPSFEAGSSMERGSSFESDAAKGRYQSGRLSSSAEQGTSETSLGVPGSRDGVQKMGYSYEVSGSMERGDSYDQERLLGTGEFTELGGSAGGSIELSGSPGESMDIGGSMDSEEPPMPPPRVPRRGGRSPALPPSVGSGWSPTPARRKRRQKSTEVPEGGDQSMEYEEEGTEETPTLPYRRRRPGSQSSLVSSEAPLGEETTSSGWVTETTAATSTTAEFESGQAAPDSTPSLATTDTSLTARMEAVTVAAGGEAVLVVSLENIQVAKISWQKGGREIVPGPHYTTTETQKAAQLIIHGATTNDTGTYTALVTKPDGSQARAAVALQVASLSAPTKIEAPTFVRSLSDLAAKVGTRVRFLVELRQAHDVKVFWYHNNVEVVEDPRFRILHEGNFFCVDISPLTVDDEGPWRCLAENSYGQASSNASLRVIVPKGYKKPVFLEELEAILTAEGTVSLECKVVGVPTPVLRWFKDGNEIKAGDVFALTANPEDPTSLGTYTCEAVNCMGRALSSSRVRVVSRESSLRPPSRKSRRSPTPIGPPPKLVEELVDKRVKVGEKGRMLVKVETPPEVLSVTWYNNGKKIEASEKYRLSDEGGGKFMIEITPTELGDDGEWKAVVRTEGGYSSSTCKLTLTVPRNYRGPRFLDDLRAVLTEEGLVSFECKVVGYPTPVLQWFKDGQELKPGDVYQLSGTNSLGKYSCIAKNCMGEAQSSAELTIEDIKSHLNEEEKEQLLATNVPPRFIQGLKSRDIKIGDSVRLTVQVTMTPTPEITWYHEDEVVVESKNYHISKADGGLFHLDISSLDLMEQGEWKCLASNDFGHSVTAASIKLVIPRHYKKPVFLEPLRAVLSYEGTVNLECKVIGVPQPVLKWFKDGTELKPGDIHRIISGEDGTCCLGTYTCEAINVMGSASSSAALLGFEDKLLQKEGDKISLADARGIARNPSLSTINEERSSQISVYESRYPRLMVKRPMYLSASTAEKSPCLCTRLLTFPKRKLSRLRRFMLKKSLIICQPMRATKLSFLLFASQERHHVRVLLSWKLWSLMLKIKHLMNTLAWLMWCMMMPVQKQMLKNCLPWKQWW